MSNIVTFPSSTTSPKTIDVMLQHQQKAIKKITNYIEKELNVKVKQIKFSQDGKNLVIVIEAENNPSLAS